MKAIQIARDNILNIDARKKVLISTIDASFELGDSQASVYGIHRRMLETWLQSHVELFDYQHYSAQLL